MPLRAANANSLICFSTHDFPRRSIPFHKHNSVQSTNPQNSMPSKIGVLAVQGSFKEHLAAVARMGSDVIGVEVRVPEDLVDCAGLIIPGGESTAIAVCLEDAGLLKPVRNFAKTKPVWGICAGLILLADKVDEPSANPALIGGLKITVKRNAFGRQIDSKFRGLTLDKAAPAGLGTTSYFIRAPLVTQTGAGVTKLASVAEGVVAVRDANKLATCFHPEISSDDSWLRYFLTDICKLTLNAAPASMPVANAMGPWMNAPALEAEPGTAVKRAFAIFQQGGKNLAPRRPPPAAPPGGTPHLAAVPAPCCPISPHATLSMELSLSAAPAHAPLSRRHHGRGQCRAGSHRGGGGRSVRDGPRAHTS